MAETVADQDAGGRPIPINQGPESSLQIYREVMPSPTPYHVWSCLTEHAWCAGL